MKEFKKKVAVITGAASGIGRAIAHRCAKEGMKVVLAGVNEENLLRTEAELKAMGGAAMSIQTDVARRSDVEALAQKTLNAFGAVHLLVNNAGVGAGTSPWDATWDDWDWVIGVNLWGVIHGVKVFTPLMLAQNTECHIVNTSSTGGLTVSGSAPYVVSKSAVIALSENMYFALQQRSSLIKVSLLIPGFVKTQMASSGRNRPLEKQNEPIEITPQAKAFWDRMNAAIDAGIPATQVADQVFDALKEERFYIITHPQYNAVVQLRMENLLRAENPTDPRELIMKLLKEGQ